MKQTQTTFAGFDWKISRAFVGPSRGNPRVARPIAVKRFMHLVLKSNHMNSKRSFLARGAALERLANRCGSVCALEVKEVAIAHNHVHLLIKPRSVRAYKSFIRALTGLIVRLILRSERGAPSRLHSFWQARPFTRIVEWGKDLAGVKNYLMKNRLDWVGMSRLCSHEMLKQITALNQMQTLVPLGFG